MDTRTRAQSRRSISEQQCIYTRCIECYTTWHVQELSEPLSMLTCDEKGTALWNANMGFSLFLASLLALLSLVLAARSSTSASVNTTIVKRCDVLEIDTRLNSCMRKMRRPGEMNSNSAYIAPQATASEFVAIIIIVGNIIGNTLARGERTYELGDARIELLELLLVVELSLVLVHTFDGDTNVARRSNEICVIGMALSRARDQLA